MVERGEADIVYGLSGELCRASSASKTVMLAPVVSGNFWLWFPGFQDPKNPFHDKRVRQAVSLAIDREAINQAECAGLGAGRRQLDQRRCRIRACTWPKWEHNVDKAKEASGRGRLPERLQYDWLTPAPPYFSRGERVALAASGHRHPRQAADARARRLQ